MRLESGGHATSEVGEHGEQAFNPGDSIMHHILDSNVIEIPIPIVNKDLVIPLPQIHLPEFLGGFDISITKHVVMMWLACGLLLAIFTVASRRAGDEVPRGLRNMLETLILFIRDEVARKAIPAGADRFVPYLLTTFFFILSCNLLGLVPWMSTATGDISVTAGLALLAFAVIQVGGMREYGFVQHFKNLVPHGLPAALVPLMFVLELLSSLIKPFALCIRLFANMMAGHVVILALLSLIFILPQFWFAASPMAVFFALFIYLLEILVSFLQAYIFTMLTAQFIGMSVHPSH